MNAIHHVSFNFSSHFLGIAVPKKSMIRKARQEKLKGHDKSTYDYEIITIPKFNTSLANGNDEF